MISAQDLLNRVGKRKFIEITSRLSPNGKTGHDRSRGIKGRVRFRMCEHGTWIIDNYEPKPCLKCVPVRATKGKDFRPYFNVGLGHWVESRSEEKKVAKSLGLTEAG